MSGGVRLFNLTDVPTPELESRGLVNVPLIVGRTILAPGEEVHLELDGFTQPHVDEYVRLGAMSAGELPASYRVKKAKKR